jgi:hypothetical protein
MLFLGLFVKKGRMVKAMELGGDFFMTMNGAFPLSSGLIPSASRTLPPSRHLPVRKWAHGSGTDHWAAWGFWLVCPGTLIGCIVDYRGQFRIVCPGVQLHQCKRSVANRKSRLICMSLSKIFTLFWMAVL